MPPRKWKHRLSDMQDATNKILSYCEKIPSDLDFSKNHKTFDACIRNFQILGEAAAKVPREIQSKITDIPWREIKKMRNLLVHEYFGVSSGIVWNTIKNDLPKLKTSLEKSNNYFDKPLHPWRICPPGEIYIRQAHVKSHEREGHLVRDHLRRDHCREIASSSCSVLTPQELHDMEVLFFSNLNSLPTSNDLSFGKKGTSYDSLIGGWVKYWNEVFNATPKLDPNIVKALIASESSFEQFAGKNKRNSAKGLMQLMPLTIRYLNGERNELADHIFNFQDVEVYDPSLNIAAGIRWLFRKRDTASSRLKRQASWEEAVEEYKDYLRRRLKNPTARQKGMEVFKKNLEVLRKKS